jgi:hypothetical protein
MGEDDGEREEGQSGEEGPGEGGQSPLLAAEDPPSHEASADDPPSREASADAGGRIQAGKRREVQVQRPGKRKYFDEAAQAEFLEWFAATCNLAWSAEEAGFNYKTVLRHRMNDERFAEGWDRAVAQGYARVEAKRLETKRKAAPIGIEGDRDAPEMDEMSPERMDAILRERGREVKHPDMVRRQGRRPRIASNAEVRAALVKRLAAFGIRVSEEKAADRDASLPLDGGGQEGVALPPGNEGTESPPPPQPLEPQIRPPDEPKSGSNPIKGEGEE